MLVLTPKFFSEGFFFGSKKRKGDDDDVSVDADSKTDDVDTKAATNTQPSTKFVTMSNNASKTGKKCYHLCARFFWRNFLVDHILGSTTT